jgi:hypothetical protein
VTVLVLDVVGLGVLERRLGDEVGTGSAGEEPAQVQQRL